MIKTRIFAFFIIILTTVLYFFSTNDFVPYKLGLDLAGGTHLTYIANLTDIPSSDYRSSMQSLRDVVERRVNILGVSEPLVLVQEGGIFGTKENSQRLIVELPGVDDIEEAKDSIGRTPLLQFKLLDRETAENIELSLANEEEKILQFISSFTDTGLDGSMLKRAQLEFNPQTGEPLVGVIFNDQGKGLLSKITKENEGNMLGIFLDGAPISVPFIRDEIRDGRAQISGVFSVDEAKTLVRDLNYGALPVPISLESSLVVGASLGDEAVDKGIRAGVVAFILVSMFMIAWYRLKGVVASIALFFYILLNLAIFKLIPVTLTAPGIAGLILSLGMAVDANVLIFERIKEELKNGKNKTDALKEGFDRAWLAIRDSNLSSLITACILYYFASTTVVKGFALVFFIGVLTSMISAITVSKILLKAVSNDSNQ